MDTLAGTIVAVMQLIAAGFVLWGGWLCVNDWFAHRRPAMRSASEAKPPEVPDFERVASLVLLALLYTTLVAAG